MASLTIRKLDDAIRDELRLRDAMAVASGAKGVEAAVVLTDLARWSERRVDAVLFVGRDLFLNQLRIRPGGGRVIPRPGVARRHRRECRRWRRPDAAVHRDQGREPAAPADRQ